MDMIKTSQLDRVLIILTSGLSLVLIVVGLSFVFPKISISNPETMDDTDVLSQEFVEVEVDYDFLKYQEFVDELTAKFQNEEYAIALRGLPDSKYDFSINGDTVMGAASTYKLFTAYSMYKSGSVPACLTEMIVYSDNDCPENWGRWSLVTSDARALGANSTNLNVVPTLSTANDLALFLTLLYEGKLLPSSETEYLLSIMKTQVYREGIPTGIPEAEVADKVGFLDGVLNDAAIVYSEKGDFVLVIMTNGYSWRSIANTATEIYAMM